MTDKKCDGKYKVGEVLRFEITANSSVSPDTVVMTEARWELTAEVGQTVLASGAADIDGNKASFVVPFERSGRFCLTAWAEVPPETVAASVHLEVKP